MKKNIERELVESHLSLGSLFSTFCSATLLFSGVITISLFFLVACI